MICCQGRGKRTVSAATRSYAFSAKAASWSLRFAALPIHAEFCRLVAGSENVWLPAALHHEHDQPACSRAARARELAFCSFPSVIGFGMTLHSNALQNFSPKQAAQPPASATTHRCTDGRFRMSSPPAQEAGHQKGYLVTHLRSSE